MHTSHLLVVAYDRQWRPLQCMPLHETKAMSYGVREDFESGERTIATNWCPARPDICYWEAINVGAVCIERNADGA